MNITKESTGELTALITIEICPADYTEKVDKLLSDHKKKANLPGFRPGHVPTGLIKKMFGKAVLAEEVNHLLSDGLINYIRDEKLDILGNPLPNLEKQSETDFENQDTFTFYFDLGLAPTFTLPFDQDLHIENFSIIVDDKMADKYIEESRKRFGKKPTALEKTADENEKPANTHGQDSETEKEPEVIPAEMNADFFELVYPGKNLQTEEEFRSQIKKDISMSFNTETDTLLYNSISDALVKNTQILLPDAFLKRWLAENHNDKYTPDEIESEYPSFVESIKWQLIENKIIKENSISVSDDEIRTYIRTFLLRQVPGVEPDAEKQKQYESIIDAIMKNDAQVQRINDQLYNSKLIDFFKKTIPYTTRETTYDDFINIASKSHGHEHSHTTHEHEHGPEEEHTEETPQQ